MGTIFKAINILLSIVLVIIAGAIAFVAIPQFGNQALIVRSGSMEPTIGVGSIVVVRPSNYLYREGDIIAFRSEKNSKTNITHRIVSVEKDGNEISYKTKGDANEEADGWTVPQENILGKSYFILPAFGKVLEFAKSSTGLPVLIIFPAALVIVLEFFSIIKELRKNKTKKEVMFNPMNEPRTNEWSWSTFKILIPLILITFSVGTTFAFPSDTETSTGNTFTASTDFSITPTATPSATLTEP